MESYKKRLTNMIWRSMAESIVLCLAVLSFVIYLLYSAKFIVPITSWGEGLRIGSMLIGGAIVLGAAYGYWNSNRTTRRLELLMETMQLLEIGSLSRSTLPPLGEDEIGRLGEQLGRVVKKWEEQVASLQRLSNNNAQLAEKARVSAIIEERQRLARELHDAVSQQLFAISMTATAALRTLDKDFGRAQRQIHLIEEMSSVAQSEMRALLLHLRPVHLEGKQLSEGLNRLLEELKAKVPMEIMWEVDENITLTKGIEDHLFRIVQEAMSNALRHSKATKLELRMQQKAGWLRLLFRDNGIGFDLDEEKQTSYGISTMRERVNEIGGSLQLVTAPGSGTRIEIRVPIIMEGDNE
ncbi:sensor histidine kinase [Paenibacillus sp. FJAT-26967]|uniref:sensor histidine kinase n=1 Tax=Paenibacillus sp. FJAT-26967 TaxID=1729690 RepID=UPI0008392892|nr:sensor histidine kinase [Paenibacillus sp. FJAT-26967]